MAVRSSAANMWIFVVHPPIDFPIACGPFFNAPVLSNIENRVNDLDISYFDVTSLDWQQVFNDFKLCFCDFHKHRFYHI